MRVNAQCVDILIFSVYAPTAVSIINLRIIRAFNTISARIY